MTTFVHTGHVTGYAATCAACRLEGAGLADAPKDPAFLGLARARLRFFPWSEGRRMRG